MPIESLWREGERLMHHKRIKAWLAGASAAVVAFSAAGGIAAVAEEPVPYTLGDVDGKNGITSNDALIVLQAATGKVDLTTEQITVADVDGKQGVASADALMILQYATQKIDHFPAQGGQPDPGRDVIRVAGMDNCCFALDPSTGTWNKRVREELDKVEQELGCTFSLSLYDSSSLTENCIKADKAGSKFADLMVTTLWQQSTLLENRVLQDLNSVQGLNLSNAHWDQNALDSMRLYGKNFIACTTWDGPSSRPEVLYFNKTLAKQVGSSDTELYRMVNDGTWTFSQMHALSQKALKDLNGNGIDYEDGTDQYGFTGMDIRQGESYYLFKGMGGYFTKTNETGDISYALGDAKNISALRSMQVWLLKEKSVFNWAKGGNRPEISGEMFREGRVLFLGGPASAAPDFAGMQDDWGILPYPKEDRDSGYASAVNWNTQGFSIPRQVRGLDLERAAQAMEKIAQHFEGLREEQDGYLAKQVYRDTQTAQMVDIARDAVTVDLCQFGDLGSGGMSTIYFLFDNVANDPATWVNSVKEDAISSLNTFLNAIKA